MDGPNGHRRGSGLVEKLRRLVEPALKKLFPSSPKAVAPITLNLCANFFGLGSAATPFGLAAMRELEAVNDKPGWPRTICACSYP